MRNLRSHLPALLCLTILGSCNRNTTPAVRNTKAPVSAAAEPVAAASLNSDPYAIPAVVMPLFPDGRRVDDDLVELLELARHDQKNLQAALAKALEKQGSRPWKPVVPRLLYEVSIDRRMIAAGEGLALLLAIDGCSYKKENGLLYGSDLERILYGQGRQGVERLMTGQLSSPAVKEAVALGMGNLYGKCQIVPPQEIFANWEAVDRQDFYGSLAAELSFSTAAELGRHLEGLEAGGVEFNEFIAVALMYHPKLTGQDFLDASSTAEPATQIKLRDLGKALLARPVSDRSRYRPGKPLTREG